MNPLLKQLMEQISNLKQARDELDDLIDETYEQVDQRVIHNLHNTSVEESIDQIQKWQNEREEVEELLEDLYKKLDQYYDFHLKISSL